MLLISKQTFPTNSVHGVGLPLFFGDGTTSTTIPWARERHRLLLGLRTFSLRILCHGNLCGLSRILWWWFYDVVLLSTNDDIRSNCSFMDSIVGHVVMDLSTNSRIIHRTNQSRLSFWKNFSDFFCCLFVLIEKLRKLSEQLEEETCPNAGPMKKSK